MLYLCIFFLNVHAYFVTELYNIWKLLKVWKLYFQSLRKRETLLVNKYIDKTEKNNIKKADT